MSATACRAGRTTSTRPVAGRRSASRPSSTRPSPGWRAGPIAESAAQRDLDPFGLALDTMAADRGATMMIVSLMSDADVDAIVADPSTSIGSDQLGVISREARVHPRAYGTFVRVLGRYVRDRGTLELPAAIRRMTGMPAEALGLADRGRLRARRGRRHRPVRPDDGPRRLDLRGPDRRRHRGRDRAHRGRRRRRGRPTRASVARARVATGGQWTPPAASIVMTSLTVSPRRP